MVCCFIIPDLLLGFKKTRPSGDADRLEGRGYGEDDSLICSAVVCYQEIRLERIHSPGDTFDGGIIGLKIDANISPVHCASFLKEAVNNQLAYSDY